MRKRKNRIYLLAAVILAVALGGCGAPGSLEDSTERTEEAASREEESGGAMDARLEESGGVMDAQTKGNGGVADVPPEGSVSAGAGTSSREDSAAQKQPEEEGKLPIAVSLSGEQIGGIVYSEGRYSYRQGALYGYLAEDGSEITPCVYSAVTPFSEGLACVCLDGKYGYIGKDGETVLPFVYDQASPFQEGRAYFCRGEAYGLIRRESLEEQRLEGYESISAFREGRAYFCRDGLYGYMDLDGQTVIEPVYDDAGYFYDGLAVVRKNGLCGVVGKDGEEVLPCRYDAVTLEETYILGEQEDLMYCFDRTGRELLSGTWNYIREEEGMLQARREDKCVLADANGKILYEVMGSSNLYPISGRELLAVYNEAGQYGIVDYEGQIIVPFQYEYIGHKVDEIGLYYTDSETGKGGYLDGDSFAVKIPAVYDYIGETVQGRAVVSQDEKYGVLRADGTLEYPLAYDRIVLFSDGSLALWNGDTAVLRDRQGHRLHAGEYAYIREVGDGYELEKEGREYSYRDRQGQLVVFNYMYGVRNPVPGSKNSYLLENSTLLITEQESGADLEEIFLRNRITPEAGLFADYLHRGSLFYQGLETPTVYTSELGGVEQYYARVFYKLYRIGEEKVLYFHAAPWERSIFPESLSGLFAVRDGEVVQLLGGYECGGSMRGDYVSFAYDREQDRWKPGVWGSMGGFGGFLTSWEVYTLQNGEAAQEVSFRYYNHGRYDFEEEELLENAHLLYDYEDHPYTAETILELEDTDNVTEYSIDGIRVTVEEYRAREKRYREFLPLGLSW